jgi:phosphoglycolate phosphatase
VLLLFDIDGTLIRCGGAGRRAMDRAFAAVFGVGGALDRVRLDGSTDPIIIRSACEHALGRTPNDSELERVMSAYFGLLEEELEHVGDGYLVMPGVVELIERAASVGRFVLGLATGNHERGARIKLERGRLNGYFGFGGFGSDAAERRELVAFAIERGQALAGRRYGRSFDREEIFVFGDTAADVSAAKHAGAVAVGVLHGSWAKEELASAGPDLLVGSFADPLLHERLGLLGVSR